MAIKTLKETIDYGRPAGDVEFEFLRAGIYESLWWNNGYRYRIEKDWTGRWKIYYIFAKHRDIDGRDPKWVRLSRLGDYPTLKDAKTGARGHNLRPRYKYKFAGRVKQMDNDSRRAEGKLRFKRMLLSGQLEPYASKYLDPADIGKVIEESCTDGE